MRAVRSGLAGRAPQAGQPGGSQCEPGLLLATISFWAAAKRASTVALPEITSAAAWPSGPQTEFMAGMFGIALPPLPASWNPWTSLSDLATSL